MARRSRLLGWLGPAGVCYLFGIALGNLGLPLDHAVSESLAGAMGALAIPLLLFSTDFPAWLRLAGRTVLSFALLIVAVSVSAVVAGRLFAHATPESWKVAGMLVGVYVGTTGNMTAIKLALGVSDQTFILLNAADVMLSAVYMLFLLSFAQGVLLRFLPRFKPAAGGTPAAQESSARPPWRNYAVLLACSALLVAAAAGATAAVFGSLDHPLAQPVMVLSITTAAIAASFSRKVRAFPGSFALGEYLLLIFCAALGSLADLRQMLASGGLVFAFCAVVLSGSILLHYLLAALFRIDADTVIITNTAGIFGPAFIGPIAAALKNKEIVVSGMTTSLVGIAVANYVGVAVAYYLKP